MVPEAAPFSHLSDRLNTRLLIKDLKRIGAASL